MLCRGQGFHQLVTQSTQSETSGSRWTRDEVLVALNLYCRTPFGRLHARNPEIIRIASALGRTPSALAMKCCNLAAFDPSLQSRGVAGLRKASKIDRLVWEEFAAHPEQVGFESETRVADAMDQPLRQVEHVTWEDVHGLDRQAVTKVRVNQDFFRSLVLTGYNERCAICTLPLKRLLVASHIVPWSVDTSLRMNPQNGICLCSLHDRAFDCGILGINAGYTIEVSKSLERHRATAIVHESLARYEGKEINLPDRWCPDPVLLERHRKLVFV